MSANVDGLAALRGLEPADWDLALADWHAAMVHVTAIAAEDPPDGVHVDAWRLVGPLLAAGWTPPRRVQELLTLEDIRARFGWSATTARAYRDRGTLPRPDRMVGRTPVWLPATIDEWEVSRPGQGVGGGRPRKA